MFSNSDSNIHANIARFLPQNKKNIKPIAKNIGPIAKFFVHAIRNWQESEGLTQKEAAKTLSLGKRSYEGYHRGEGVPPLEKIETILGKIGFDVRPSASVFINPIPFVKEIEPGSPIEVIAQELAEESFLLDLTEVRKSTGELFFAISIENNSMAPSIPIDSILICSNTRTCSVGNLCAYFDNSLGTVEIGDAVLVDRETGHVVLVPRNVNDFPPIERRLTATSQLKRVVSVFTRL